MDQPPVLYDPDKVDQLEITSFLSEVVAYSRKRVVERKSQVPLSGLNALTTIQHRPIPIANALRQSGGPSLIATVKSQQINGEPVMESDDFHPVELARTFVEIGAKAVSVTTDPKYYRGNLHHLMLIAGEIDLPVLRQDFIFEEYQVIEARAAGADGITLIASMLGQQRLRNLLSLTQRLRMSALVVVHNEEELARAVELDPRLIGINNRDWSTFEIDVTRTERLAPKIPDHIVVVSVGGISSPEILRRVADVGVDAVQVGSHLLTSDDPLATIQELFSLVDNDPTDPWKILE
jgi:indole-3-glycerol phosphate synthase